MNKTRQTLTLLFSVLVLAVSVSGQGYFVEGEITWVNRFGVVPSAPGASTPAAAPCSIFSVVALDARTKTPVVSTNQATSPFQFSFPQNVNYFCKYSLQVPTDRDLFIIAVMGNAQLLPKLDRDPYLITDAWIAPSRKKLPAGYERVLTGHRFVNLRSRSTKMKVVWNVDFDLSVANTGGSEYVVPAFFSGAWQTKFGESLMTLLVQQTNAGVTGQLNANSADLGVIRGGLVVGNTLRFNVVRTGIPLGIGARVTDQHIGTGELVMDEGGKSFKGIVLGTPVTGNLLGP